MTNPKPLQQLVLRQMLMEGSSADAVLKSIRTFKKSKKTPADHLALVNDIRQQVAGQSKDLMTDEALSEFIRQHEPYVGNDSVLD